MKTFFKGPVIFVKDIQRSKVFYQDLLNEELEDDFGNNIVFKSNLSLWQLKAEYDISVIEGTSSNGNTFELFFETEDIEKCHKELIAAKVKMFQPIKTEPWGQKTIRFFDPDHHLIEIGESLDTFIKRIFNDSSSIKETASRTGVSEERIKSIVAKIS